ncbi:MAG: hypothetical protein M3Q60_13190 [Actinomycetota bacterium]|nr:hypothetical protein [Actinomycetota bacterium]
MAIASHPEEAVKCEQNIRKAYVLRSFVYRRGWGESGRAAPVTQGIGRDVVAQRTEEARAKLLAEQE